MAEYILSDIYTQQRLISLHSLTSLGTNIWYDMYCVRENQHPHAYYSLYLSIFSFFPIKFFIKDFSGTTAPRILKFSTNIGYDLLYMYLVNENQLSIPFIRSPEHEVLLVSYCGQSIVRRSSCGVNNCFKSLLL